MKQITAREFQQKFSEYRDSEENIEIMGRGRLIGTYTPARCMFPGNEVGVVKIKEVVDENTAVVGFEGRENRGSTPVTCVGCHRSPSVGIFYEYDPSLGLLEDRPLELCKKCSTGFTRK